MLSELFDEEYLRKQYDIAERKKNIDEGIEIGVELGIERGVEKGKSGALKHVADKLRKMGLSDEQILEAISD